jgi:addiction module HigA family antidote
MPKTQTPASVLQSLMDEYQLNPFSLSKELHLGNSTVRLLAIGKANISVSTALRLAKFFGQTPAYWLNLQREADLNETSRDKELEDILKAIPKVKKSAATKEGAVEKPNKNQKPSKLSKKTTITTAPRTTKNKGTKKVVRKK